MAKIGIIVAIILVITIPTVIIFSLPQTPAPSGPTVTFCGQTVSQNVSIYYSEIADAVNFDQKVNRTMSYMKSNGMFETHIYTGVSLWALIVYSGVTYGAATAIRFVGSDGFASPAIPIKLCQQNPELTLFAYEKDGVSLGTGDAPYITIVNHSVVAPKVSSRWQAKKTVAIEFMNYPDWNVTIYGNVELNSTIYYAELFTYSGFTHLINQTINYTTSGGSSIRLYSSITLKQILDYSKIKNTTVISTIRFVGSDFSVSYTVNYAWVQQNDTKVLVTYARDGVLFNPTSDGYLRSVVDFTLTDPNYSGNYATKYLLYIEIS